MAAYESDIVLGHEYRVQKLGLRGIAESVHFYRNACERVMLIYMHEGEVKEASFDAVDLTDVETDHQAQTKRPGGPERTMPAPR